MNHLEIGIIKRERVLRSAHESNWKEKERRRYLFIFTPNRSSGYRPTKNMAKLIFFFSFLSFKSIKNHSFIHSSTRIYVYIYILLFGHIFPRNSICFTPRPTVTDVAVFLFFFSNSTPKRRELTNWFNRSIDLLYNHLPFESVNQSIEPSTKSGEIHYSFRFFAEILFFHPHGDSWASWLLLLHMLCTGMQFTLRSIRKKEKGGLAIIAYYLSFRVIFLFLSLLFPPKKTKTKKTPVSLCTAAGRVELVQNNPKQKPKKDEGDLFLIRFV